MDITIVPLTVNSNDKSKLLPIKDKLMAPIIYWGVYLNDECVSYTSNKELAERTKIWVRNWLSKRV